MATAWLAVCCSLLRRRLWRLFCVRFHAVYSFYHLCASELDDAATPDPAERERYATAELAIYRQVDDAIRRLLAAAGGPALRVSGHRPRGQTVGGSVPLRRLAGPSGAP
jgi:hypothetical protein